MSNVFDLDDRQIVEKFVHGSNQLLASKNLRLEVSGNLSQLIAQNGDVVAIMYLQNKPRNAIIKNSSPFAELIDDSLIDRDFVLIGDASRSGFTEYRHYVTPAGYRAWYTDPAILWKKWWPTERFHNKQRFNMDILVNLKDNWYPVQDINVNAGIFTIKTIAGQLILKRNSKVLWLAQIMPEAGSIPKIDVQPIEAEHPSLRSELQSELYPRNSPPELAKKIQQKQSEINTEQAWTMIKELEHKLQAQIKLHTEIEEKYNRSEHRAIIAEQRLKMVHQYLNKIGIDPQDIYNP